MTDQGATRMPEDDRKDATRDAVGREVEGGMNEQVAGLPPSLAEALREKIRLRVREEIERDLRARTASDRRDAVQLAKEARKKEKHAEEGATFLRFNRNFRFQHILYTILTRDGRRDFLLLLPKLGDAKDTAHNIRHFLGKVPEKPRFGRFSYIEKFDYWAVYWGCIIMIGSGLFLWFETYVLRFLPKYSLDVAHEMHSDEAMLATLAIVIWHFYNVHFNPDRFPGTLLWWHGQLSEHEMKEEHPLEYEEILARRAGESAEVTNR